MDHDPKSILSSKVSDRAVPPASVAKSVVPATASPNPEPSTKATLPRPKGSTSFVFRSHRELEYPASTRFVSMEWISALPEYIDLS